MKSKSLVMIFLMTCFLLAVSFFSVLFIYDPLKIFHQPFFYKEYLQSNMRKQVAGIANNWEYDSIILGTSILECTSAQEASNIVGGRFVNISLSGSYFFERAIVLKYVLEKKPIKNVIYSLDTVGLIDAAKSNGTYPIDSWSYLYDNNPFNDFKVYLDNKYIRCLFSPYNKIECMGEKVDFDRPNTWHTLPSQSARFGGLKNWFKMKNNPQVNNAFNSILTTIDYLKQGKKIIDHNLDANIKRSRRYIDDNLIRYIASYPDTEFILILPPYSRIKFAIDAQYNELSFRRYKASIRYLVSKSFQFNNMKVYGWGNHAFVDQISNYKDLIHYEHKINSWMLGAIKRNEGVLTTSNIDSYLKLLSRKSLNYNLFKLGNQIENNLGRS